MDPPDPTPDLGTALADVMPKIRSATHQGWAMIIAAWVLALPVSVILKPLVEKDFLWVLAPFGAAAILTAVILRHVKHRHVGLIMPHLARTMGLSFRRDGKAFLATLPERLLPKAVVTAEDHLTGRIGGREVDLAEVKVETGGKNSRTLFKGLVIRIPNLVPLPAAFVAPAQQTEKGFLRGAWLNTNGLFRIKDIMIQGAPYAIWASAREADPSDGLDQLLSCLTGMGTTAERPLTLYTATSNREVVHLAYGHESDLFNIGGLLARDEDVMAGVRAAFGDLSMALKITSAILALEARLAATPAPH
jgi:hypothetical protein